VHESKREVPSERPPCPVCASTESPTHLDDARDEVHWRPGRFALARCRTCGLVFTSPRPTAEARGRYCEGIYSGAGTEHVQDAATSPGMRLLASARIDLIEKHARLDASSRLLDVGCSYGTFLSEVHRRTGCQVAGCDTDPGSLAGSVAPDEADLRLGAVADVGFDDASFDAVTLYHLLEHTPDPVATLSEARRLLTPGGLLVVEVPNYAALWRRLLGRFWFPRYVPQHLIHFEPETLADTAARAGFADVRALGGFFSPLALTLSLAIALQVVVGLPPKSRRPLGRWLVHTVLRIGLIPFFLFFDVPCALLLWRSRLANHQVLIARKA